MSAELIRRVSPRLSKLSAPHSNGGTARREPPSQSLAVVASDLGMLNPMRLRRSPRLSGAPRDAQICRVKGTPKPVTERGNSGDLALALVAASDLAASGERIVRRSPRLSGIGQGSSEVVVCGKRAANTPARQSSGTGNRPLKKRRAESASKERKRGGKGSRGVFMFVGDPVPEEEARRRWPWQYQEQVRFLNALHSALRR